MRNPLFTRLLIVLLAGILWFVLCTRFDLGIALWVSGPAFGSPLVVLLAFLAFRVLERKVSGACDEPPVWKKHSGALFLPLGAAFLWFGSNIPLVYQRGIFLLSIFFLPVLCALSPETPIWVECTVIVFGVPAQYLLAGILLDALRGPSNHGRRAWACLVAGLSILGFLLYIILWVNPYSPRAGAMFPNPAELAVIMAAYGVAVVAFIFNAVREWRRGHA